MSNADLWMPLYVARYLTDTGHLTTIQHGAYMLLLMHYWCNGPLPDDDSLLAATARLDPKLWRKTVGPVVRSFFQVVDGRLHQKRADLELSKAGEISGKRRAAAIQRHRDDRTPHPPPKGASTSHANAPANAPPSAPANGPASGQHMQSTSIDFASLPVPLPVPKVEPEEELREDYYKLTSESPVSAREREDVPSLAAVEASRREFSEDLAEAPAPVAALIHGLAGSLRMKAYPPREPLRTRNEQVEIVGTKRRPKDLYLTREQINQQLRKKSA